MMFRYSARVFSSNFSACYKLLIYRIIVALIIIALAVAIFLPNLLPVISDLKELGVFNMIKDTFEKLSSFSLSRDAISQNISDISDLSKTVFGFHSSKLINTYIGGGILILLGYFLNIFADIPLAEVLYGSMQFQAKYNFSSSMLTKFNKALKYSLFSMLIFLPIDLVIVAFSGFLLFYIKGVFAYFSPFIASTVFILLYALRMTFSSAWAPTIIAEEERGVVASFKESLLIVSERFGRIYSTMLVSIILSFASLAFVGIFTLGAGLILLGVSLAVFFMCFRFVVYFAVKGKKYYLDYETIVTPKKLRDKEENFTYDLYD